MSGKFKPTLSCVIIDDEQPAHNVLRYHIEQISWLTHLKSIYSAVDALTQVPALGPDIIFLDVNMPNLNGLTLLDLLPGYRCNVILCSAHSQYALDGYDYEVSSFLLKPVNFEKFLKAVNKLRLRAQSSHSFHNAQTESISREALPAHLSAEAASFADQQQLSVFVNQQAVWVKADKKHLRINLDEIKFIEAQRNYIKIYYGQKQELLARASLLDMENSLPPHNFIRTHKSYIVNRGAVTEINGNIITLDNNFRVSISKKERSEICRRLTQ